jgi:hypothetical protein
MKNVNEFKKNGYCVIKNVITDELRDFVTQYALFDEMQDFNSESMQGLAQVPNAHSKYADPTMEVMLLHLHKTMEENTGLSLFPTYSYYRVYRPGDDLKIHKDRPSCEISCTLCFNYSYDDTKYQWPIYMAGNKVNLSPGDMVIYRGCDLEHWRDKFDMNEDAWHVQGFFHYVDQNGPYASFKYDERTSIGAIEEPRQIRRTEKPYIKYI